MRIKFYPETTAKHFRTGRERAVRERARALLDAINQAQKQDWQEWQA